MPSKFSVIALLSGLFALLAFAFGGFVFGMLIGGLFGFPSMFGFGAGIPSASALFAVLTLIGGGVYIGMNWNKKVSKKKKRKMKKN